MKIFIFLSLSEMRTKSSQPKSFKIIKKGQNKLSTALTMKAQILQKKKNILRSSSNKIKFPKKFQNNINHQNI